MLGDAHYDWPRFWTSTGRQVDRVGGFLPDPLAEFSWLRPSVETFRLESLDTAPCLVLLGEPGLGKSHAVKDAVARLRASADQPLVQRVDLAAYPDAVALRAKLLEGKPWHEWVDDGRTLHLYLDSLDEALLQFGGVHKFLAEELGAVAEALPRLRLRVACRSTEWISEFARDLRHIWPAGEGGSPWELTLAPLREVDAREAARVEGLDPERFIKEVRKREVEEMAAIPLTLAMLVSVAAEGEGLPQSRRELFERGVADLLAGPDPIGDRAKGRVTIEPGEAVAVAERIAAATLLSRRSTVSLVPGRPGPMDVDPAEITGFEEVDRLAAGGDRFQVEDRHVLETLRTALFTKSGPQRVAYAHAALAEYCAGSCVARAGLAPDDLRSLLVPPGDSDGRLVPQLREVAAWAASIDSGVLDTILVAEPEVLLRSDQLALDESQRARIVGAILNPESAERIARWDRRVWISLARLDHRGLADQLDPIISDPEHDWTMRRLAITIAMSCRLAASEATLLKVALDPKEPAWVRDDAVGALREYASPETRRELVPLAIERIEDDTDDEIKGQALKAVFPELISPDEALEGVTPPRSSLVGAYASFLHLELPRALGGDDIKSALRWAARLGLTPEEPDPLDDLVREIVVKAWPLLDDDEVAESMAAVIKPKLLAYRDLLEGRPSPRDAGSFGDLPGRRRLIQALLPSILTEELNAAALVTSTPVLLDAEEDAEWVLSRLEDALGIPEELAWARVARMASSALLEEPLLERTYALHEHSEELSQALDMPFDAIKLDSDLAANLKEHHNFMRRSRRPEEPDRRAEFDARIEAKISAGEGGDEDAWWQLNYELLFDEHGREGARNGELEADLTELPGWKRCSEEQHLRMIAVARTYLGLRSVDPATPFGTRKISRPSFAAYRALHLLAKCDAAAFIELPAETWEHWMPIVVDYPTASPSEGKRLHDTLLGRSADLAPDAFSHWAQRKIEIEMDKGEEGHIFFLRRIEGLAPVSLQDGVAACLDRDPIQPSSLSDLLEFALRHDPIGALRRVEPKLRPGVLDCRRKADRKLLVAISSMLLSNAPELGWPTVRRLFKRCKKVGKDAFGDLAHGDRARLATEMADEPLAELVAWAYSVFPESDDSPLETGAHFVSRRESAGRYRTALMEALALRGTPAAVDQIKRLHERYGTDALRFALRGAKDALRSNSPAPSPADVVRCLRSGASRPPADADALLDRALSALDEIRHSVQVGQPPLVGELWNTRGDRTPKDEGELSNWLVVRLREKLGEGFDVQREPLARGGGRARGKSLDLQVSYLAEEPPTSLSLIIEVKGSWESNVKNKMRTQLVDGYMAETGIDHGVYLVFWFDKAAWAGSDPRRRRSLFTSAELAREFFENQAAMLRAERNIRVEAIVVDASFTI